MELESFLETLPAQAAERGESSDGGVSHVYGVDLGGRAFYQGNVELMQGLGSSWRGDAPSRSVRPGRRGTHETGSFAKRAI